MVHLTLGLRWVGSVRSAQRGEHHDAQKPVSAGGGGGGGDGVSEPDESPVQKSQPEHWASGQCAVGSAYSTSRGTTTAHQVSEMRHCPTTGSAARRRQKRVLHRACQVDRTSRLHKSCTGTGRALAGCARVKTVLGRTERRAPRRAVANWRRAGGGAAAARAWNR